MALFNMPLLMVMAFLLYTLLVGLQGTGSATTFRAYAVGTKRFTTATLVTTILATQYGGYALIRNIEQIQKLGLAWIIFGILTSGFPLWIISQLSLRMGRFMHHLSMPETIGSVYGKYPRLIIALSTTCNQIVRIATEISIMSVAMNMCIDSASSRIITILATLMLIAYSIVGGIRAVTSTNVVQFITFFAIVPFLALFLFVKTGKTGAEMLSFLQSQEKFQFSAVSPYLIVMLADFSSSLVSSIEPVVMQRMYMSAGLIQANKVFFCSSIFDVIIFIFITLIGLFVFMAAPELPVSEVWDYTIANIPSFFKGLMAISLLAMTMSTVDSKLHTCSIMVSHDILKSIRGERVTSYSYQLRLAKLATLVLGLIAMMLAFYYNRLGDLFELVMLIFTFYVPIVAAPLILAFFGFRGTSLTALIGMATGTLAMSAWYKWMQPGIAGVFLCMIANGLAMMAAHYLLPQPKDKGWIGPDDYFKQIQQAKERARARAREGL